MHDKPLLKSHPLAFLDEYFKVCGELRADRMKDDATSAAKLQDIPSLYAGVVTLCSTLRLLLDFHYISFTDKLHTSLLVTATTHKYIGLYLLESLSR